MKDERNSLSDRNENNIKTFAISSFALRIQIHHTCNYKTLPLVMGLKLSFIFRFFHYCGDVHANLSVPFHI